MAERICDFLKRQADEVVEGLIAQRKSGEPFFGVQTVFAPLIDKLVEKREAEVVIEQPPETKKT